MSNSPSESASTQLLDLEKVAQSAGTLGPHIGNWLAGAAVVCLDNACPATPPPLTVRGSYSQAFVINCFPCTNPMRRGYNDLKEAADLPITVSASFQREQDPELPQSTSTRLVLDGGIKPSPDGPWWFRKVEGWVPKDPLNPNNGQKLNVLIVWRKLTDDLEKDNLMLDEWFRKLDINSRDSLFDIIYVNGSNNLQNLAAEEDQWKVRLIEEEFMKRMWEGTE